MEIRFKRKKLTHEEKGLEALRLIKNCRLSAAQSSSCGAYRIRKQGSQDISQYRLPQKEVYEGSK